MAPEPFGALDAPHLLVRVACLAGVVVYATSFTTDAAVLRLKYKSAVRWAVLSALLHAYRAHGVPKLSADYARRLFTDPHAQRLFGVLILLVGSGSLFGLIPVADAEVAALLEAHDYQVFTVDEKVGWPPDGRNHVAIPREDRHLRYILDSFFAFSLRRRAP